MSEQITNNTNPPAGSSPSRTHGALWLVMVLGFLLLVGGAIAFLVRLRERQALAKETEILAVPTVIVTHPKLEANAQELVLPATLQAYTESPIYARTNGYLAKWYKDIGSRLEKGQLLAEIETPEIDQELQQARAVRDQAIAQLNLAKSSAERWETLRKMDAVAQQETDERASGYTQGQAAVASATANVRRLEQLESFKHIYAPFSGVLTLRNTDIGALITAGSGGQNQELFVIAQVNPIRVYVEVPEIDAAAVRKGVAASIELPALPGDRFSGKVSRTADALDLATRTLRTEIDLPNPKGQLLPGSYAQVHFALQRKFTPLVVSVNTLLFRAEGTRAAVVGSDGVVHLKAVTIGRDYGTTVEILNGLEASDSLIVNPSDSLEDGQAVHTADKAQS